MVGSKIREKLIIENWPDILRAIATMAAGMMRPSQFLRKFASYPRQHELTLALRDIGRIERTLFIIDWLLDADMQPRANIGLNKGEAHHALKNALRVGRQGEIRDRTAEGQHYCMAGLNPAGRDHHILEHQASRTCSLRPETHGYRLYTGASLAHLPARGGRISSSRASTGGKNNDIRP